MPTFYGYTRASTAGQEYTFESQQKKISAEYERAYKDKGFQFGGFFEDKATSGAKPLTERDQGFRLWATTVPGDVICVAKMDRAFRNTADAANLLNLCAARNIGLVFLDIALDTSTSLGKFVAHLLASVAELEREWIKTRTKEALAIRQSKGLPHGGRPPAGWMKLDDGDWAVDETERKLIEWFVTMHDTKGWSWLGLAKFVTDRGIRRANGDRYHQPWIHYALKAREAGYPGKDGWREQMEFGGSVRREGAKPHRRKSRAGLPSSPSVSEGGLEESSLQSGGHDQTPSQMP